MTPIETLLDSYEKAMVTGDYYDDPKAPNLLKACRELVRGLEYYDAHEYHSRQDNDGQIQYVAEKTLARAAEILSGDCKDA